MNVSTIILFVLAICSSHIVVAYRDSSTIRPFDLVQTTPLQFNITAPASLSSAPIAFVPAFGGGALPWPTHNDSSLDVRVMLPHASDDISACVSPWKSANEFNQSFAGAFVLLQLSSCSYTTFLYAAMSGAAGIIVYGCPAEAPYNCETRLQEVIVYTPVTPPILSISTTDGQKLVAYLNSLKASGNIPAPDSLTIRLRSTGNIVPEERAALVSITQQVTMGGFAGGTVPTVLPLWSATRFSDPTIDPCRNRVKGLWCEAGHVVFISVFYHAISNPSGLIPKEFGAFKQLRYLNLQANALTGAIPAEWCSLTQLVTLILQLTPITSLPDCMSSWSNLEELSAASSSLTTVPVSFRQLTNIRIVDFSNNLISNLPDPSLMTRLTFFNVAANKIAMPFPVSLFHPDAPLTEVSMGTNAFTGQLSSTAFSQYAPTLQVLDLNTNYLSGALPLLVGCTSMRILDLSSQRGTLGSAASATLAGFNGSMPLSWKALQQLNSLYLQENSLQSPFFTATLVSLANLDLSHNLITCATASNPANGDVGLFLNDLTGPSMVSLRLSYNFLNGPLPSTNYILLKTLRTLFLDHNGLTSLSREIFVSSIKTMDFSYNNISNDFPINYPKADTLYLDIRGNPYYKASTPLDFWITVSDTRVQQKLEPFSCAPLSSNTAPLMNFLADPTLYSYAYCDCEAGTFGSPPVCALIPSSATLNPMTVISSSDVGDSFTDLITRTDGLGSDLLAYSSSSALNKSATNMSTTDARYSQAFSDSMYGEVNRLTQGMSTSWVVDLRNLYADDLSQPSSAGINVQRTYHTLSGNATLPSAQWIQVRTITIRLHVNLAQFNTFDDVLSVYEGGSDLLGTRVLALRGNQELKSVMYSTYATSDVYLEEYNTSLAKLGSNQSLIEVQVFSPIASVQFISRAAAGLHFFATYSYDFDCPDSYFFDTSKATPQCRLNRELFQVGDSIRSAVFAVTAVALAMVLGNIIVLLLNWSNPVYKASSRVFMLLTLIFLMAFALGALLFASIPSAATRTGDSICIGRAWLSCLPLAGILGVFLAKSSRLNSIFGSNTLRVKVQTDLDIFKVVFVVVALQIAMLAIFSGLPLSRAVRAVGKGSLNDELVDMCSQESGFMSWIGAEIAFIGCLMLPAAYLGFKCRDLPSQYNESSHIQNALILLIFFAVIIIPLDIFIQDTPEAAVLIQGLGQAFLCIILTAVIFGPKIYYLILTFNRSVSGNSIADAMSTVSTNDGLSPTPKTNASKTVATPIVPRVPLPTMKHVRRTSGGGGSGNYCLAVAPGPVAARLPPPFPKVAHLDTRAAAAKLLPANFPMSPTSPISVIVQSPLASGSPTHDDVLPLVSVEELSSIPRRKLRVHSNNVDDLIRVLSQAQSESDASASVITQGEHMLSNIPIISVYSSSPSALQIMGEEEQPGASQP